MADSSLIDRVDAALKDWDKAHAAAVQFNYVAGEMQRLAKLPFLPESMNKAIIGLDKINAVRSNLLAIRKELQNGR